MNTTDNTFRRSAWLGLSLLLFAALAITACKSSRDGQSGAEAQQETQASEGEESPSAENFSWPNDESAFFTQRRSPCMGECPIYRVTVWDDGLIRYEGHRFTELIGTFRADGGDAFVHALRTRLDAIDFVRLDTVYPSGDMRIMDMPATTMTMRHNDGVKTILNHNYSDPDNPEEEAVVRTLMAFAKEVDALLEGLEWTEIVETGNH